MKQLQRGIYVSKTHGQAKERVSLNERVALLRGCPDPICLETERLAHKAQRRRDLTDPGPLLALLVRGVLASSLLLLGTKDSLCQLGPQSASTVGKSAPSCLLGQLRRRPCLAPFRRQ